MLDKFLGLYTSSDREYLKKAGVFYAKANGFGKAVLNAVTPGEYDAFVFSRNTNDYTEGAGERRAASRKTFPNGAGELLGAKFYSTTISVGEGEELEFEHDFGLTSVQVPDLE